MPPSWFSPTFNDGSPNSALRIDKLWVNRYVYLCVQSDNARTTNNGGFPLIIFADRPPPPPTSSHSLLDKKLRAVVRLPIDPHRKHSPSCHSAYQTLDFPIVIQTARGACKHSILLAVLVTMTSLCGGTTQEKHCFSDSLAAALPTSGFAGFADSY